MFTSSREIDGETLPLPLEDRGHRKLRTPCFQNCCAETILKPVIGWVSIYLLNFWQRLTLDARKGESKCSSRTLVFTVHVGIPEERCLLYVTICPKRFCAVRRRSETTRFPNTKQFLLEHMVDT